MTTEIKAPTDDELREAVQCVRDGATVMFRERVPKRDGPEFREHETDNVVEAMQMAQDIRWNDAVASDIVYIEIQADEFDDRFDNNEVVDGDTRTNIKVTSHTKRTLDECKRENETWDECLQRLAQLDLVSRTS